jgi:hypothetical protein
LQDECVPTATSVLAEALFAARIANANVRATFNRIPCRYSR